MADVPVRDHGPRAAVSARFMEQVVDVPVHGHASSVYEKDVEQVADVPCTWSSSLGRF